MLPAELGRDLAQVDVPQLVVLAQQVHVPVGAEDRFVQVAAGRSPGSVQAA